jgi:hypothetical protein
VLRESAAPSLDGCAAAWGRVLVGNPAHSRGHDDDYTLCSRRGSIPRGHC